MVADNIIKARERISRAGGDPDKIALVAVTKGRDTAAIREAIAAGITDIGENRVREAEAKFGEFCGLGPAICGLGSDLRGLRWHFIGHLQTNKAKEAVKIFDLIQSVDSLRLAQEIDKQAARINKVQNILIEIKMSPEESKTGLRPEEAAGVIAEISRLKNVSIKGLMTIAPAVEDPELARPYFRQLRELRDKLNAVFTSHVQRPTSNVDLGILSMGMTDDFEAAVIEGATMVRVGRAIFD